MDKQALLSQLESKIRHTALVAEKAAAAAAEIARDGATPHERSEDMRVTIEYGSLARGQGRRLERAKAELEALEKFRPGPSPGGRVGIGAIVEIEDEESGDGRCFFLAPVGAGTELTVPGSDGFLSVVTPSSPIGRAVLGHRVGDSVEVNVEDDTRYYQITFVE